MDGFAPDPVAQDDIAFAEKGREKARQRCLSLHSLLSACRLMHISIAPCAYVLICMNMFTALRLGCGPHTIP